MLTELMGPMRTVSETTEEHGADRLVGECEMENFWLGATTQITAK